MVVDGIVGKDGHEVTARDRGRGKERCRHPDAASRHQRGDHRVADIGDDAGLWDDLDGAVADPERPAERLAAALILQVDSVVSDELVRVLRRAAGGEVGRRREGTEPARRQPPRDQPDIVEPAGPPLEPVGAGNEAGDSEKAGNEQAESESPSGDQLKLF